MPFETDLAHALNRTTDSLEPDLTPLLNDAIARGRTHQRRRRNAGILAGAAACAVLTAGGLLLPDALARIHSPSSDMEPAALALPRSAVSGDQMIQALQQTFPGGKYSQQSGQSNNPADPSAGYVANGGFLFDDGHGPAFVGISAVRLKLPLRDGDGLTCDRTPARPKGDTCTLTELPDTPTTPGGAVVMSERNAADPTPGSAQRWTLTLTIKSTGAQLQLTQWNSKGGGTAPETPKPTRPTPPLTEAQAVTALTSPTWTPILSAVG
ncbi:hypothetical protein ACIQWR_28135 [Streptomyces sp. NPDC098789]|uniref:hypothetical protein n=1 Tax=Streptomyces sp. NPDC098789 TaxID=3366098 RepID=UPI0038286453